MMTSKVIYGYLLNIVCVTGIIGNILSFIIMRTREFRDSTTSIYLQVIFMFYFCSTVHYQIIKVLQHVFSITYIIPTNDVML